MKRMTREEILEHLPEKLPDQAMEYIDNVALEHSRYLFYRVEKRKDVGYCSVCRRRSNLSEKPIPGQLVTCRWCGKSLRARWAYKKAPEDMIYATYAMKSTEDPDVLVFLGIFAMRKHRTFTQLTDLLPGVSSTTDCVVQVLNVFRYGFSSFAISGWFGYSGDLQSNSQCWAMGKSTARTGSYRMPQYLCVDSIREAVDGTPFRYMPWQPFIHESGEIVRFFSLAAKYPSIEYLVKLGFGGLVFDAMYVGNSGSVHMAGKKIEDVLRIPRQKIAPARELLTKSPLQNQSIELLMYQWYVKDGIEPSQRDINVLKQIYVGSARECVTIMRHTTITCMLNYPDKQMRLGLGGNFHNPHRNDALRIWADYINDCKSLKLDLTNEHLLFPADVMKAHQEMQKRVVYVKNKVFDEKIGFRIPALRKAFQYESDAYVIRPAVDTYELIQEGATLNHCVGGYAERYAAGHTIIMVIRKKTDIEAPYYTLELRDKKVVQCHGKDHKQPPDGLRLFLNEWKAEKLSAKTVKQLRDMVAV